MREIHVCESNTSIYVLLCKARSCSRLFCAIKKLVLRIRAQDILL
jgi:hypothetical protein